MPERIQTATLVSVDPETLEINDTLPGTYGFYARLSCDPGTEWSAEFEASYTAAEYPGKPPIFFRGDTLCIFYLPVYGEELPRYLSFLNTIIEETNQAVERRNAILPDDAAIREKFRAQLKDASVTWKETR